MKKSVVCVLLCAIILISGCNTDSDRIKIGLVLALTGDLSSYGVAIKEGVELAMDEVDTTRFELVFMDSKGNSKDAVSSLYSLINIHDVRYIIGDVSSSTTLSMIPIIERADIFLLSPGAATPQLTNISKLFARNYPSSADESIKSASYMLNNITRECVAVIHSNDDYGIGLSKVFSEYYIEEGGDICFRESYETGTKNFRDILARLSQLNFKAVYLSGNQKEMGAFIRQYREYGFNQKVIANMAFLEDDCIKVAGDAAEGVIIPIVKYDIDDNSLFFNNFKNKYNTIPTLVNALGYDAIKLVVESIEKSGNSPIKAAQYVRNLQEFDSSMGILSFKDGNIVVPIEFKEIKDGKVVVIE